MTVALVLGALAGCGSGHSTTTTKKADAPPAVDAQTLSSLKAFGQAVNLRPADVPAFKQTPERHEPGPTERQTVRKLLACAGGEGATTGTLEAASPKLERSSGETVQEVRSAVEFAAGASQAEQEISAIRKGNAESCARSFVEKAMGGPSQANAKVEGLSVSSTTPRVPGSGASFAWKISASVATRGLRVPFYIDLIGFTSGRAKVMLQTVSVFQPFPPSEESKLLALLAKRAEAASAK